MEIADLGDVERQICEALIEARLAWQTPDQLAATTGIHVYVVGEVLADLDVKGWVAPWEEWPGGLSVTFTPIAAERFGVRIIELGPGESPRWARADVPEPWPPKAGRVFRDPEMLGLVVDPTPDVAELLEPEEPAAPKKKIEPNGAWPDARREAKRAEEAKKRRKKRRKAGAWSA